MTRAALCLFWLILIVIPHIMEPPLCSGAPGTETAFEFSLDDLQGRKHSLSDYRGNVVIVNFWATWCPECVEEISSLNALYEKYRGRGLVVIGIATDRRREPVESVLKRVNTAYLMLLDNTGGALLKRYRVIGLPSTVIIDKKGLIAERIIGRTDFNTPLFERKIESLLGSGIK